MADLLELAKMAPSKNNPANWFAKAASKAQWERTLKFLAKAREVALAAVEVAKRIKVPADKALVVLKACWRLKGAAIRHAITAAETTRNGDPFRYFSWLCAKVGSARGGAVKA